MKKLISCVLVMAICAVVAGCAGAPSSVDGGSTSSLPSTNTSSDNVTVQVNGEYDVNGVAEGKFLDRIRHATDIGETVVFAYINGKPLYFGEVLIYCAAYNLPIDKYLEATPNADENDPYLATYQKTDEELYRACLITEIIDMEAQKENLSVDANAVKEAYLENFRYQEENMHEWLSAQAEARGLTLEQYRIVAADNAVESAIRNAYLEKKFPLNQYADTLSRDKAVTEYIESLIGTKYNIVREIR